MIALTISGCCARCEYIELQLHPYQFDLSGRTIYELDCVHSAVCGKLQEEALEHPLRPLDEED